jgi:hypothetical protein
MILYIALDIVLGCLLLAVVVPLAMGALVVGAWLYIVQQLLLLLALEIQRRLARFWSARPQISRLARAASAAARPCARINSATLEI